MDNFDNEFSSSFDDPFVIDGPTPPPNSRKKRGLHWIQTLIVLIVTALTAFLLYYMLDIRYSVNPTLHPHLVLFNGLFFALLAAAILITAFLIEFSTSAMTPRFGRKLQLLVAIIAIVLCGLVGALGELLFVKGYVLPQIAPTPTPIVAPSFTPSPKPSPVPTPAPQPDEVIIIALDKSYSMENECDKQSTQAVTSLLSKLTPGSQIGLITFSHEILESIPLASNSMQQQQIISTSASIMPSGGTDFVNVVNTALNMFRDSGIKGPKKLIFITDGAGNNVDKYIDSCVLMNTQVSAVMINGITSELEGLVTGTNGIFTSVMNLDNLLEEITSIALNTPTPSFTPSPSPTPKPTPLPQIGNLTYVVPDAEIYLAVILILQGLIIGLSLTLMLSLERQFRIQPILSPIMGLCAFLLIRYHVINPDKTWLAYVLFGIVLMRRNYDYFNCSPTMPPMINPTPGINFKPVDSSVFGDDDLSL